MGFFAWFAFVPCKAFKQGKSEIRRNNGLVCAKHAKLAVLAGIVAVADRDLDRMSGKIRRADRHRHCRSRLRKQRPEALQRNGEQRQQRRYFSFRSHLARYPESTGSVTPVMQRAAGPARNRIAAAISSTSGNTPSGVCSMTFCSTAGFENTGSVSGVRTKVGATALTRIFISANSSASARVRLTTAPLEAW